MSNDLPLLVRFGFLWNRLAPRGRGFVPRQIGKLYGEDDDYIIRTAHGARLRMANAISISRPRPSRSHKIV